jgi:hypothetical protein
MLRLRSQRVVRLNLLGGLLGAIVWFQASGARAGDSRMLSIDAGGPAPLAVVARILERRYGAVITYEDPVYASDSDLIPYTGPPFMTTTPWGQRRIVRSTRLAFSYPVSAATGQPEDLASVIQQAIDLHASAGNPGRFRLARDGAVLHIVPERVQGRNGEWENANPFLDAKLELPDVDRNLEDTIALIIGSVNHNTGSHIASLQEPLNTERRIPFPRGVKEESARDLLTRAVGQLPKKSSWTLRHEPRNGMMAFEIHEIASRYN